MCRDLAAEIIKRVTRYHEAPNVSAITGYGELINTISKRIEEVCAQVETPVVPVDAVRLEWIAENSAAIRKIWEKTSDPHYFVIYRNGTTSGARNNVRDAIDLAIEEDGK